jgi:plasmid stability protein
MQNRHIIAKRIAKYVRPAIGKYTDARILSITVEVFDHTDTPPELETLEGEHRVILTSLLEGETEPRHATMAVGQDIWECQGNPFRVIAQELGRIIATMKKPEWYDKIRKEYGTRT